jgi:hypothetical protein
MTDRSNGAADNRSLQGGLMRLPSIARWWSSRARQRRRSRVGSHDILENRVVLATAVWQSQGPGVTQNGQAEGIPSQNNPVVGAVHTVITHPTNADIMWIGAVNGGIWRTNNATATTPVWTPLTDQQPGMSMGALYLDTTDATSNTLVAGIGRFSSLASDGGARTGLLRTTDGGTNWTQITGGGLLLGKNISGVAAWGSTIVVSVNIADSFTFGNIGIFRSTDGGASFTQISVGSGTGTGLPGGVAYDLVTDPSDSNVLYTSIHFADILGGLNGVYKSTNRGANWSKVSNAAMDALLNIGTTNNLEMAVGSSNNVYAAIVNQGQLAGLFRSGDGGANWTQLDTPQTNENGTFIGLQPRQKGPGPGSAPEAVAGSQGSTHQSIAADPTNPNVVYLGGDRQPSRTSGGVEIGTFPNSLGAQNFSGRLFRVDASRSAGSQVTSLTHQVGIATTLNSSPHADSRDMAFDALGRLIEVNDGGVYLRSNPAGLGDWIGLMGQSLQVTEFHSLAYDPLSNIIIGGTQDTGTPFQTAAGSMIYTEILQGDGGVVQVDAQTLSGSNQSIRYMSFQNYQQFRREVRNASGGLVSASNPGLIVAGSGGQTLRSFDATVQFYQPYELNAITPSRAIIGTQDLYETTDQFANLTRVRDNSTSSISAMAYGGNGNADAIYYGNTSGQFFVRTASAGAFTQRTSFVGGGQTVRDIVLDSRDWQTAFFVDTNQVFMTTDAGVSFTDITGNLLTLSGGAAPRTITFLVGSGLGGIVVGTDRGAFLATSTAYNSWMQYGVGLPNMPVTDLRYNAADNVITAGTLGRGAWMVSNASTTLLSQELTIVQSGGTTDVTEGGATDSFTVALTSQPTTDVVVSVTSANTLQATGNPTTLTFTSTNWNVPQTVTATAVNDNLVDGTVNVSFTISVVDASSDDTFDAAMDRVVTVITRDNDVAGLLVVESSGTTDVTEGGATDSFTVALTAQPTSNVVISVTSGNTLQATGSPSTLTFTSANWNVAQTVTVTAVNDNLIDGTVNVPFTLAVVDALSDNVFDPVLDVTVTAIVRDNDTAGLLVVESAGTTDVTEGGATDSFTVALTAQPTSNVVVSVTSGNTLQATGSPSTLTFTSVNWNVPQTVTISAVDDILNDGTVNVPFTLAVVDASSDDTFDPVLDVIVTAIVRDNDTPGLVVIESGGTTDVTEGGATDSFTVALASPPASDVVVSVTSGNTSQATGSPTTLTFTTANWNLPQTVTVTAVNDNLIDGTVNVSFTVSVVDASSDDAFDPVSDVIVAAIVRDNDFAGLAVVQSGGTTDVTEGGATDSFTVALTAQPTSDVVVSVTSGNTAQTTGSPSTLTFTSANWNTPQTVTATAVNDDLVDGTVNVPFTLAVVDASSDDAFDSVVDVTVTVITRDNDVAGLTVVESGGTTDVTEGGATDSFTVALTAQPLSDVVVSVTSGNTAQATGSPTTLTFTSANWNTPQTVTATAVNDNLADGTVNVPFTLAVVDASSDDAFDSASDATVTVITRDNDTAGLAVVESGGTTDVTEAGATDSFTVALTAQPTSNVVVSVTSGNTAQATGSPTTLTFTSVNWNVPQTVTVTAVDDGLLDGVVNVPFTVAVVDASSDDAFDGVADVTVTVITREGPNRAPTALGLSNTSIAENVPSGAALGNFTTTDPDGGTTFTYSLVGGAGATDNGSFTIVGNQLRTNAAFDFETKSSYSIRVSTTDNGALTLETIFTISVVNVDETPLSLTLSHSVVSENVPLGTPVGTLTSSDSDVGSTFTYSLVAGAGSTDNASFTIVGNELRTNTAINFEVQSSYAIRLRARDQGGLVFDRPVTITVADVNESPTALALSNTSLAENVALGTGIGNFTTTDPDAANTFTYSLVSGTGSTDNASFLIVGNQLRTNTALDFETKSSYAIRVRTTDQIGLSFEQTFTITVTNANEQPTDLALSNAGIAENVPTGTGVGTFTTTDPDAGNTFTYSLVSGAGSADNSSFRIVGDQLQTNAPLDFETKSLFAIRVRTTDQSGLFIERALTITVADVFENRAPVLDASGSPFAILGVGSRQSAEMRQGTLVSDILARGASGRPISDADAGAQFGIAVTSFDRSKGTFQFTLVGNPQESDWIEFDSAGMVSSTSALLLPTTARVRFNTGLIPHHAAGAPFLTLETVLDTALTFRAWDRTAGTAGGRADTSSNGGVTSFSASTETVKGYFEARLFRTFNTNAALNIYTLEAEFNALVANPSFQDRSTSAFTGFTILMSAVPELGTVPLLRMYYGVQFNDDGTETDLGYRYLTTNEGEASFLEGLGRADKRPTREGSYFRELEINNGTSAIGHIFSTQQPGTLPMTQIYRTDASPKPTRPGGTREGDRTNTFVNQQQGDHVYTTNTAFETSRPGTWVIEAVRGFVRELSPNPTGGTPPASAPAIAAPALAAALPLFVATDVSVVVSVPSSAESVSRLIAVPTPPLAGAAFEDDTGDDEPVSVTPWSIERDESEADLNCDEFFADTELVGANGWGV